MVDWPDTMTLGVVLYPGFSLLDATAPLHPFCCLKNVFDVRLLGEVAGPIESAQGPALVADASWAESGPLDLALVPGGSGARRLARDPDRLRALGTVVDPAGIRLALSSGAGLLGALGLLRGVRATTVARALTWAREVAPHARWEEGAAYVDTGSVVTAAGPAQGIDMALHVITRLTAPDVGENIARSLGHDWIRTPTT